MPNHENHKFVVRCSGGAAVSAVQGEREHHPGHEEGGKEEPHQAPGRRRAGGLPQVPAVELAFVGPPDDRERSDARWEGVEQQGELATGRVAPGVERAFSATGRGCA